LNSVTEADKQKHTHGLALPVKHKQAGSLTQTVSRQVSESLFEFKEIFKLWQSLKMKSSRPSTSPWVQSKKFMESKRQRKGRSGILDPCRLRH